jgi:hypothetical protein
MGFFGCGDEVFGIGGSSTVRVASAASAVSAELTALAELAALVLFGGADAGGR